MKFDFQYPKLLVLLISIFAAYSLFSDPSVMQLLTSFRSNYYLGTFEWLFAGMLFSFGFTAPFAVGFFITSNTTNLLEAALIAGFGAMLSDLLIFKLVGFTFTDEFERIKKTKIAQTTRRYTLDQLPQKIQRYLTYTIAGFILASPLPDEIGITMLSGFTQIKPRSLAIISYIFNTMGIAAILLL